jgi:hypothetical protein
MTKPIAVAVAAGAALVLSACYESPSVTVHKAGVYKGEQDPLMKADAQGRADTLQKRFTMVQTDR